MKKYYLYGAGINCIGVIKFFGKQYIKAVIDSDEKRQGSEIEGIPIISLQQYLVENNGEIIIISAFFAEDRIAQLLENEGIRTYYKSPYMQMGFYDNVCDIIQKLELDKYNKIIFATTNPISELISKELYNKNQTVEISYIDKNSVCEIEATIPVVITNEDDKKWVMQLEKNCNLQNVLDINAIYYKKYLFKNARVKKFKDIHKGKRCFIIGNGPSLTYEDLDILKNHKEICFGVNRIYLSYEFTRWRPDYYVAVDYTIVQNDSLKILDMEGIRFIRHFYKMIDNWDSDEIYEFTGLPCRPGEPHLSTNLYEGIYTGNTVVYDAIQIALYMGFREIYLLGVDMTSGIRYEDQGAHFYKTPNPNENLGKGNTPEARKSLGYAAKEIERLGATLRNATRGGELEEVQRVDFDSLF